MNRREFMASGLLAAAAYQSGGIAAAAEPEPKPAAGGKFKLKYAPHFGMFKNLAPGGPLEELKFAADQGFTAWEDNGMAGRPKEEQERIAAEMTRLGITMGVFVAYADFGAQTFVHDDREVRGMLLGKMREALEVAKRVNARWTTVVPGCYDPRMEWGYQTANVVDHLKACCEICEPAGLIMVLEPLNPRDHPNLFLSKVSQGYAICRAVGSPYCKILDDLYHQQVTEGNLIPNMDAAWNEIAYFQLGDNPGRCEPTTGEVNYRGIFRHIHDKGFKGLLGMEHGNSKPGPEGEKALLAAYRECDSF